MAEPRRGRLRARLRRWGQNWRTFRSNRLAVIGLVMLGAFLGMLIAHPVLMATVWGDQHRVYDPILGYDGCAREMTVVERVTDSSTEIDLFSARLTDVSARVGDVIEVRQQPAPPSARHLLGTDPLGRDILSMLLAGTRPTFVVGLMAAITTALVGVAYASVQAVMRGRLDAVMSRISDMLILFPAPLVMIVLGAGTFGDLLSPFWFGLFYGLLAGGSTTAIVLRSHVLTLMGREFVESARVAGARRYHLIAHHLVPHLVPLAAVSMLTAVVGAAVANGFASYLAYGHDMLNWGLMVFVGVDFSRTLGITAWNSVLAPSLALSLFCASFYLISLGVRDIAQPRRTAGARVGYRVQVDEVA